MQLVPNSWGSDLREHNTCHAAKGAPTGGQFCSKSGAAPWLGGTLPGSMTVHMAALAEHRARMHAVSYGSPEQPAERTRSLLRPTEEELHDNAALRDKTNAWVESLRGQPLKFSNAPEWLYRETDPQESIETMMFMDLRTGKLVKTPVGDMLEGDRGSVMVPEDAPRGDTVMTIHTHPSSGPFSVDDVKVALHRTDPEMMVFGQDGSWYHMNMRPYGGNFRPFVDLMESWGAHTQRARVAAMTEANDHLRAMGVDIDTAVLFENSRERKIAQAVMDYVSRDHYAKSLKAHVDRLQLSSRYAYYLAPRKDNAVRAREIAAEYGHH